MNNLLYLCLESIHCYGDPTIIVGAAHELNDRVEYDAKDSDEEDEHLAVDVADGDQGASS